MTISVIIPTFNEAENIGLLIDHLFAAGTNAGEILVIDGGSTDDTIEIAKQHGAESFVSPEKGRAAQMNYGASLAKGDVLYFVHADSLPPKSFFADIDKEFSAGCDFGRFTTKFTGNKFLLKLNAFFTRCDFFMCYGGDQTMFIKKAFFESTGGFRTDMKIMEEFEFTDRARQTGRYCIIRKPVLISARKYDTNSWLTVQRANYTIVKMYKEGATQNEMVAKYKAMLDYR